HPGTTSLALIIKYSQLQQQPAEKKPQARSKTFKFGTLVTAELIIKKLEEKENLK
ncbi:20439_t:CDS:1, partial [Dentiscutata erythropus]